MEHLEEIKKELIRRSKSLRISPSNKGDGIDRIINSLEKIQKDLPKTIKKLTDILNEILNEKEIEFKNEKEKIDFIKSMKSTIIEISQKVLKKAL